MNEQIRKIISHLGANESIAVRLCKEDDTAQFIITRNNNVSPKEYKLYECDSGNIRFTGKTAFSPLELEKFATA